MRVTVCATRAVLYDALLAENGDVRSPYNRDKPALYKHRHDSSNGHREDEDVSDSNALGKTDLAAYFVFRLQSGSPPMV